MFGIVRRATKIVAYGATGGIGAGIKVAAVGTRKQALTAKGLKEQRKQTRLLEQLAQGPQPQSGPGSYMLNQAGQVVFAEALPVVMASPALQAKISQEIRALRDLFIARQSTASANEIGEMLVAAVRSSAVCVRYTKALTARPEREESMSAEDLAIVMSAVTIPGDPDPAVPF